MPPNAEPSILVIGAGPVGLTLAAELARHGVPCRIVDKAAEPSPFCRAIGITPRSLEVFEDMGIARELIDAGIWLTGQRTEIQGAPARETLIDFSDLPYSALGVPQYSTEAVLARHLAGFGIRVERSTSVTALRQDESGVEVELETPEGPEQAVFRFVVGCDGAHSVVRKALGIAFDGEAFPMEFMLGDVRIDWDLPRGMAMRALKPVENAAPDLFIAIPLPEQHRYRVTMQAPQSLAAPVDKGTDHGIQLDRPGATISDLQAVADRLLAEPAALSDMRWSSIFRISMRLAEHYRVGNALIAGDACHIHPPTGGQGMNTGVQDAYNLAWKLALVVAGKATDKLLDSYEAERRPVAEDVVARTTEQSMQLGRERKPPDRLQDTQLLVNYREGPLASGTTSAGVRAGDRVPEVQGLRRQGVGFALRMSDLLRGPSFVLVVAAPDGNAGDAEACAAELRRHWPGLVRVVAVVAAAAPTSQPFGVELVHDAAGEFAKAFAPDPNGAWLIRPDKYVGQHLGRVSVPDIVAYLQQTVGILDTAPA
ncbi:FAD-dependent monooxygenase [Mesorhizobium sp. BR1-1-16]|uniref:FAD-dependent monooxygenase n=1 Tax=Mesorhizobium sp. BR1-1-16 TaxID=2876653 RepID=UPI001CCF7762|nr:FAD-dependent monooxygenase [Mesorhizobium sp. BR1-1-16]MBZ9936611.1 FAD-dependent monooxygenase [Mesorhizobium sp. BR1-1-16]